MININLKIKINNPGILMVTATI